MTNEELNSQSEPNESSNYEVSTLQRETDLVRETIESACRYPQVSGIGTELGYLHAMREQCESGITLSTEQLAHVVLVKYAADELTNNYSN